MRFTETAVEGCFLVDIEPHSDERGLFARTYCETELAEHGVTARVAQANLSYNPHMGTLRGLHRQVAPHEEAKLVRCVRGAIFDVAVDVRPGSPTYLRWAGAELTAENRRSLLVPEGCLHGFLTLAADTEVLYQVTAPYAPGHEAGARYDDPAFGIDWPGEVVVISDKDAAWAPFETAEGAIR